MAQTFYVNPASGSDSAAGSQSAPFKTITKALTSAQGDTRIQLAAGNYGTANGETFPLSVPSGVTVVGNEANKGNGIAIAGGGEYVSSLHAKQAVTIRLADNAELRGVSVTNPQRSGTAVWIESTNPTVANCTLSQSKREGIFITGDAAPKILNNQCLDNSGNGISITRNAKGEIRGNTCKRTGYGISIDGNVTSLIVDNTLSENRIGIVIGGEAQPVLRNNRLENNTEDGLTVTSKAFPNLGTKNEPGGNVLKNNGEYDLRNYTNKELIAVGNTLNPSKVSGPVKLEDNKAPGEEPGKEPGEEPGKEPGEEPGKEPGKEPTPTFSDIQGHWAENFIRGLANKELISGFSDGTFKPNEKMTRAQYAALLVKAFNPSAKRAAKSFTDVPNDFWAKDVIQQAYRAEFLSGFPDNTFKPNENVQRVQVIVSLVNGLGLSATDGNALNAYDDRNAIPDYARDEVITATKKQIAVNYPKVKELNPNQEATRAEVAAMVYQALVDANQVSQINSPYIVSADTGGGEPVTSFPDIQNHWAKPFIEGLLAQGLISGFGDGTFKPQEKMTRAQYAALIAKAFNPAAKREPKNFLDVSDKSWAKDAIQKAYRGGFLAGYPDNTFRQGENVQRVQALVSLVSGLDLSDADTEALKVYDDREAIPNYAKEKVATATKQQIVVNHPKVEQLQPNKDATRAEIAAMVYQALVNANQVSAINSDYIVSA